MEGYIYLGEYYDVLGREVRLSDKKIGKSINPVSREYQLNRTKSPIGYTIISSFKVDDMNKVEKMLHAILDSRRVFGEWFTDDEDTLTGEFINFMNVYGGISYDVKEVKETSQIAIDKRLIDISKKWNKDIELIRTYKGVDYDVILTKDGVLIFNGEVYNTPNKLYNNGIIKLTSGKRGNSGTNNISQFKYKDSGEPLSEII